MLHDLYDRAKEVVQAFRQFGTEIAESFEKRVMPALQHLWQVIELNVMPAIHHLVDVWSKEWVKNLEDTLNKLKQVADFGFKYLGEAINKYLIPAINDATTFYYQHQAAIDTVIKYLMEFGKWIAIIYGSAYLGALIGVIIGVVMGISAFIEMVMGAINTIKMWIAWIEFLYDSAIKIGKAIGSFFAGLWDSVKGFFDKVLKGLEDLPKNAQQVFSNAGSLLLQAGKDVVQGLINGVESKIGDLVHSLNKVWDNVPSTIKGLLKFGSPSKLFKKYGQYTVQGFINGVNSMSNKLTDTMASTFKPKGPDAGGGGYMLSGWQDASRVNGTSGSGNSRNVTVTVNTNEIRPEYHAARLGQILAGRIA
jgi:hypothetical protein